MKIAGYDVKLEQDEFETNFSDKQLAAQATANAGKFGTTGNTIKVEPEKVEAFSNVLTKNQVDLEGRLNIYHEMTNPNRV